MWKRYSQWPLKHLNTKQTKEFAKLLPERHVIFVLDSAKYRQQNISLIKDPPEKMKTKFEDEPDNPK